jgi:hypothetical protein
MNQPPDGSLPGPVEAFLSGAYRRMQRIAIVLSVAVTLASALFFNWRSGLGVAIGSLLGYLNFVWLHRGAELMVQRITAPAENRPSKIRLLLAFLLRYIFVITIAYVILKSYPRMLVGFIVGLASPILAAMCEGVYEAIEAIAGSNKSTPN